MACLDDASVMDASLFVTTFSVLLLNVLIFPVSKMVRVVCWHSDLGNPARVSFQKLQSWSFSSCLNCLFFHACSCSFQALTGARHQCVQGGKVLFAVGFVFPSLKLSKYLMDVFNSLHLAIWTNGMSYAVAALSGDHWLGTLHAYRDATSRKGTIWS